MGYVDDAFVNLKHTLEITKSERDKAASRHEKIRGVIADAWQLEDHFLTGSYRRDTKTKKLKDVDIFVVIDGNGPQAGLRQSGPAAVLDALADVLMSTYSDVSIDQLAVTVGFGQDEDIMSFDVVPAFKRTAAGKGYEIPDTLTAAWVATNPKTHHEQLTAKNQECGERFVPFVKMIKGLNRELGEPVRSFLLEVMAQRLVVAPFGRYQDEVRWFLASAVEAVHKSWPDPAGLGPDVNTLTAAERATAAAALSDALKIAEHAIFLEDDQQERASVEQWRRLFGWRMPRP
jgi:predicted nucleotidyltransferase